MKTSFAGLKTFVALVAVFACATLVHAIKHPSTTEEIESDDFMGVRGLRGDSRISDHRFHG